MKILCMDDEWLALQSIDTIVKKAYPEAETTSLSTKSEVFKYLESNEPSVAFLDIHMAGIDGITLAKKIKKQYPLCNIVFTTGFTDHFQDAFELSASDYLMKPITKEKIQHAMDSLRNPLPRNVKDHKLYIQCFPSFDLFIDGELATDIKNKVKELFAFIVDKAGATVSNGEILETLWEENSDANLRIARKQLTDYLASKGLEDVLIKAWGKIAIDRKKVKCDYFDYLDGKAKAINLFKGEYMNQYLWSYDTCLKLND